MSEDSKPRGQEAIEPGAKILVLNDEGREFEATFLALLTPEEERDFAALEASRIGVRESLEVLQRSASRALSECADLGNRLFEGLGKRLGLVRETNEETLQVRHFRGRRVLVRMPREEMAWRRIKRGVLD